MSRESGPPRTAASPRAPAPLKCSSATSFSESASSAQLPEATVESAEPLTIFTNGRHKLRVLYVSTLRSSIEEANDATTISQARATTDKPTCLAMRPCIGSSVGRRWLSTLRRNGRHFVKPCGHRQRSLPTATYRRNIGKPLSTGDISTIEFPPDVPCDLLLADPVSRLLRSSRQASGNHYRTRRPYFYT